MIWYRRIAQFALTNKRSIFCDALKLSPNSAEITKVVRENCKNGITKKRKLQYQMLRVGDKLQVLQVTNPHLEAKAGCCILVEAGGEDSPECGGLAHLLEHLVVLLGTAEYPASYRGATYRFKTTFQIEASTKHIVEAIEKYATLLFGAPFEKSFVTKIIDLERQMLDNEFHQKRAISDRLRAACEILKSPNVGLQLQTFVPGNATTLNLKHEYLIKRMNVLRELYRQSRVAICIYSGEQMDMEKIVNSLNVGDFLQQQSTTAPLRLGYEKLKDYKDVSKSLIAVESEDDRRTLTLIFPIMNKLDIQESNTFAYIGKMIQCATEGFLLDHLRDKKLATQCTVWEMELIEHFIIEVELTLEGLKQIKYVNNCVKNFIQFLHDEWETDICKNYVNQMKENDLSSSERLRIGYKATHIVTHLDQSCNEYDEMDLYKNLDGEKAKNLISTHLLKNEDVVRMIFDRNANEMLRCLEEEYVGCLPEMSEDDHDEEPIYGTNFYVVASKVFEPRKDDPQAGFNGFKFPTFHAATLTTPIEYYTIVSRKVINSISDNGQQVNTIFYRNDYLHPGAKLAYRNMFARHFSFVFDRYKNFLNASETVQWVRKFRFSPTTQFESQYVRTEWHTGSEKEFTLAKEQRLAELSMEMSKSETLAMSLMKTIVHNLNTNLILDPLPLEYKSLLNMNYEHYCEYVRKNVRESALPPFGITDYTGSFTVKLPSINTNEGVTATLVFYQTSKLDKKLPEDVIEDLQNDFGVVAQEMKERHKLYTLTCTRHRFDHVDGFLCTILSVQSKKGQKSKSIDVLCEEILERVGKEIGEYSGPRLQHAFDSIKKRSLKVQVVGHKNPMMNAEATFEDQFKNWFEDIAKKIYRLRFT